MRILILSGLFLIGSTEPCWAIGPAGAKLMDAIGTAYNHMSALRMCCQEYDVKPENQVRACSEGEEAKVRHLELALSKAKEVAASKDASSFVKSSANLAASHIQSSIDRIKKGPFYPDILAKSTRKPVVFQCPSMTDGVVVIFKESVKAVKAIHSKLSSNDKKN